MDAAPRLCANRGPLLMRVQEAVMAAGAERVHHPLFARFYPLISRGAEARGGAEHRRELLAGLSGRVIEVGAGHGLNFKYYPASVREVVAVEPEPHLWDLAVKAARGSPVSIHVVDGLAGRLPVETASFDVGVSSLVLCSIAEPARALAELFRVIRPGGELRFYEHVRAESLALTRLQHVVDALFWPRLFGGCHTSRATHRAIEDAGFVIEGLRRFPFRPCPLAFPVSPHIIGRARRP